MEWSDRTLSIPLNSFQIPSNLQNMSHFLSRFVLKHEKEAEAVQLKALPLISDLSHSSEAAQETAKIPF